MQLSDNFAIVDKISESDLYARLVIVADGSIDEIFSGTVVENKYTVDGTFCRSLGAIIVDPTTMRIGVNSYGKTRLSFPDGSGRIYDLPVTDLRVANDDASTFPHTLSRIKSAQNEGRSILLRIGLARGYDGKGKWTPKRCYLQVNGIIFPD